VTETKTVRARSFDMIGPILQNPEHRHMKISLSLGLLFMALIVICVASFQACPFEEYHKAEQEPEEQSP